MEMFKLRITNVDMDGYCGRTHHPAKSDEGLVVVPLGMDGCWAGESSYNPLLDGGQAASVKQGLDQEWHEICWTCLTEDGRTLELMNHEVELVHG